MIGNNNLTMKIRELESFDDCSVVILYGSEEGFKQWLDENDSDESRQFRSTQEWMQSAGTMLGMCTKIRRDRHYVHVVWVLERDGDHLYDELGTLAHEATHMVDNMELFICNRMDGSPKNERMPRELRARVVESIVKAGSQMIIGEYINDNKHD